MSVEERLGTRFLLWIGAVAITLAGVYLVKYTFDKGLLTPTTRISIGFVFGAALLVAAEWMRARSGPIAQALAAAGAGILYACLLAAVNVYQLIPPGIGFVLIVLVTATAVLLSLRLGPLVAALGLIGGFVMPALIHTEEPKPAALFGYLLLLEVGLVAVTGVRRWWWLAAMSLLAGAVWAAFWISGILSGRFPGEHGLWVGLFLLLSVGAFVIADRTSKGKLVVEKVDLGGFFHILSWAAVLIGLGMVAYLTRASGFSDRDWAFFGILSAGILVLARIDPSKEGLAALSALAGAVLLLYWHVHGVPSADDARFGLIALFMGALHACGAYAALWRAAHPAWWAGVAAASSVVYFLLAYWEVDTLPRILTWGSVSLILASASVIGAFPIARRVEAMAQGRAALGAMAVGATCFIALAVPLELEREWISVAWALEVLALAWLESRLALPALRFLAAALAVAVTVRLLLNPSVLTYPIGDAILWNWLLYGYGVPIVAFVAAARIYRRQDRVVRGRVQPLHAGAFVHSLEGVAIALGFALVGLQVRQYFHPARLLEHRAYLAEWATYGIGWLAYGIALLCAWRRFARPSLLRGGAIGAWIGLGLVIVFPGIVANPLIHHRPVGGSPVLNGLLYMYGLPAALGFALAALYRRISWKGNAVAAGLLSVALLFLLVNLQVRQAFQGTFLDGPAPTNPEWYAYSAAWIVLGTALLGVGIATRGAVARYASLVVMLAAVVKVFLYDTRELRDLYRVFSFLGLGASLLLLAFLYQKFVFRREVT